VLHVTVDHQNSKYEQVAILILFASCFALVVSQHNVQCTTADPSLHRHACVVQSLTGHQSSVESVTFDKKEEVVAAGSASGAIKVNDRCSWLDGARS
jgi:WD40 repeat protein